MSTQPNPRAGGRINLDGPFSSLPIYVQREYIRRNQVIQILEMLNDREGDDATPDRAAILFSLEAYGYTPAQARRYVRSNIRSTLRVAR